LYASAGLGFGEIVRSLKRINKPTVVTIHTAPGLLLRGSKDKSDISIRTLRRKVSETLHNKRVFYTKLKPFQSVDKIVTFNKYTENQLMNTVKVPKERIYKTLLPVDDDKNKPNTKYRKELSLKQGDKLLAVAGFINPYKGFVDAVEAVAKLPSRYKLIILGGINPDSGNPEDLKHLESVIERLNVNDRVKMSGFIKDDNLLSAYLKACDTALYPYSPEYYKMASSDAINKSIMNNVPVVAYPTDSFKEINKSVSGAITLTDSANVKALVEAIKQTSELKHSQTGQKLFREKHSYNKFATQMIGIYNEILVQN
jgi:glycosyltransferase involved in cell wall biosynthesis